MKNMEVSEIKLSLVRRWLGTGIVVVDDFIDKTKKGPAAKWLQVLNGKHHNDERFTIYLLARLGDTCPSLEAWRSSQETMCRSLG